jgi:MFS superfamily sulfate permease-like transporter
VSASRYPEASQIPGLLIYRFGAPLIFPNAEFFRKQIVDLVETSEPSVQWFVLDAEAISDIDVTGSEALEEVLEWLEHRHVHFAMTRVSQPVYELLKTYELLHSIAEDQIYSTNRAAARAFQHKTTAPEL